MAEPVERGHSRPAPMTDDPEHVLRLREERRRLALANEQEHSEERARRIFDIDWEIAAIPVLPNADQLNRAREADVMAVRDGFDPRWPKRPT